MKNILFVLLIIFAISCKKEKVPADAKVKESAFKWPKLISDEKSSKAQKAYEESLDFKPLRLSDLDNLTSDREVQNFIRKLDTNYRAFKLKPAHTFEVNDEADSIIKIVAKNCGINKSFYKYDIDGNGFTDLLAYNGGNSSIVLMNFGKRKIIKDLNLYFIEPMLAEIIPDRNDCRLKIYGIPSTREYGKKIEVTSTELVYRDSAFVEYNPNPVDNEITKIEFAASMCYGTCPDFQLTLNESGLSYFIAKHFNFNKVKEDYQDKEEGFYEGKINKEDLKKIKDILNYLDFENLRNKYNINASDMASVTLVITYGDGKIKKIYDYGLRGTYGLVEVYKLLFDLRFSQKWIEKNEVVGIRMKDIK